MSHTGASFAFIQCYCSYCCKQPHHGGGWVGGGGGGGGGRILAESNAIPGFNQATQQYSILSYLIRLLLPVSTQQDDHKHHTLQR